MTAVAWPGLQGEMQRNAYKQHPKPRFSRETRWGCREYSPKLGGLSMAPEALPASRPNRERLRGVPPRHHPLFSCHATGGKCREGGTSVAGAGLSPHDRHTPATRPTSASRVMLLSRLPYHPETTGPWHLAQTYTERWRYRWLMGKSVCLWARLTSPGVQRTVGVERDCPIPSFRSSELSQPI